MKNVFRILGGLIRLKEKSTWVGLSAIFAALGPMFMPKEQALGIGDALAANAPKIIENPLIGGLFLITAILAIVQKTPKGSEQRKNARAR